MEGDHIQVLAAPFARMEPPILCLKATRYVLSVGDIVGADAVIIIFATEVHLRYVTSWRIVLAQVHSEYFLDDLHVI